MLIPKTCTFFLGICCVKLKIIKGGGRKTWGNQNKKKWQISLFPHQWHIWWYIFKINSEQDLKYWNTLCLYRGFKASVCASIFFILIKTIACVGDHHKKD